jgi:hypothetical protein
MKRQHFALKILALPLLVAATARGEIYLKSSGIQGPVRVSGCPDCMNVQTIQIGGQVISASAPWVIAPPPGIRSIVLTRMTDSASSALSAAFASRTILGLTEIQVVFHDPRGVPQAAVYYLHGPIITSFTSTGSQETIVLGFSRVELSGQGVKIPTVVPTPPPTAPPRELQRTKRPG